MKVAFSGRGLIRSAAALALAAGLMGAVPARAEDGAPAGCTGPASQTWINIEVNELRSGKGLVAFTLYADNRKRFLVKGGSLYVTRVQASNGTTRACLYLPGPGTYAIAVYHDENASQTFDRTGLGLPKEGFGFSNNPGTLLGLPNFSSVRLAVPKPGLSTKIRMKYP